MNRRHVLSAGLAAVVPFVQTKGARADDAGNVVTSGTEHPVFAHLDAAVRRHVAANSIPGLALSVAHGGKLLFARGYGYAEKETGQPCLPRTLFRIGSVSKTVTAICLLRL